MEDESLVLWGKVSSKSYENNLKNNENNLLENEVFQTVSTGKVYEQTGFHNGEVITDNNGHPSPDESKIFCLKDVGFQIVS